VKTFLFLHHVTEKLCLQAAQKDLEAHALNELNGLNVLNLLRSESIERNDAYESFSAACLEKGETTMLSWSITFLVVGLIAGLLGLSGIAGAATQIAWILFVVFLVLFLVSLVMGRRPPV
jgi:uncharacterized membrane protein YtjA (UPF0391 family)